MSVLDYVIIGIVALWLVISVIYSKKKKGCCGDCSKCEKCGKHRLQ